jgi:hypothetical protein
MLSRFRNARDCLLGQVIAAGFGILDLLSPLPETPTDPAIREEGARLREAFPMIVFGHPKSRASWSDGTRRP